MSWRPPPPARPAPVSSGAGMTVETLRSRVLAEVTRLGMSWHRLQIAANASQKTITDLRDGNPHRKWKNTTLWKFDDVFGLERGTLFDIWMAEPEAEKDELSSRVHALEARLAEIEQRPAWAAEVVEAMSPLSPEDRALVLALARRLAGER